jgi:hypothetical protein
MEGEARSDNLVLEHLRAIRADMHEMRPEWREQDARLGAIKRSLAHVEGNVAQFRAEIGLRFDRVHDRLDRIGRRLDIVPAG